MVLIFIGTLTSAFAGGEHSRRAAAELQVIIADIRRLDKLITDNESTLHQQGLRDRIAGGLASLAILLRQSDQERRVLHNNYLKELSRARGLINQSEWQALESELRQLAAQFVLTIPAFAPSRDAIEDALQLHNELCAGCHDYPATEVDRPAYNLYEQAKLETEQVFFARMLVGVRGDRITGLDNPLSDFQLMSLIQMYREND